MYQIEIREEIKKDLKRVSKPDIQKIFNKIKSLETMGNIDSLKLVNSSIYRIRQGDFRIFFETNFEKRIITVFKVSHRKDAY
jgi:mRNA-degrading endonuclease RelE of RelBE toxin-antitoxin system